MDRASRSRRLIVNADDFGQSQSVNAAVIRAHREGILTSASLMVNEAGFKEAVALARENPRLGVGLHLTLVCGHSTLSPEKIPDLVDRQGRFRNQPVRAGMSYFSRRRLHGQLRSEIEAQFEKFRSTGLRLDHVNGHLHFHLHPTIFKMLMEQARALKITHLRWTRDPFWLNVRLAGGNWSYRMMHTLVYGLLCGWTRPHLQQKGIGHTQAVFGLLQHARVDEAFVSRLLSVLPAGDSELYSHPSLDQFRNELDALISPRVKALVESSGIRLIRYQDL